MRIWLAGLLLGLQIVLSTVQANPCALPGGMGRTGHAMDGSGMGGTGIGVETGGIGGTGYGADGSGVGGTGHGGDGSGMGGTGGRADGSGMGGTGVVGVITGFGSICVNGLELVYDGNTQVSLDGEPAQASSLAIGHVVSAWAEGQGSTLRALRVAVNSALAGPVSWVSPDGRSLVALGQRVQLPAAESAGMYRPRVGDPVRISGLRDGNGVVRATLVERLSDIQRPSINGTVDMVAGSMARVGGLLVQGMGPVKPGDQVRVSGVLTDGVLNAARVEKNPMLDALKGVERLSLQGVAQTPAQGGGLSLGYASLAVRLGTPAAAVIQSGQVVRVEAKARADGKLELSRVVDVRQDRLPVGRETGKAVPGKSDPGANPSAGGGSSQSGGNRANQTESQGRNRHPGEGEDHAPVRPDIGGGRTEIPEVERIEIEKVEIEKPEVEKVEVEKPEVEKVEIEKPEVEKVEVEKPEVEKVEVEKPEVEKVEIEKPEVEKVEIEKPEVEKVEVEKPEVEKVEIEKPEVEKVEVEKPEVEKVEIEKPEVEKVEVEKPEVEKVEIEKPEVEKVEIEKPEVEKVEIEKPEVEKVEVEKVEIERRESHHD